MRPDDSGRTGGKAFNLGILLQNGFPVPPGFCVTTDAYLDFLAYNRLEEAVSSAAARTDAEKIPAVAADLRQRIVQGQLPELLRRQLAEAWRDLGILDCYAVRSSALAEDSAFASFAGQQDTYLNLRGEDALFEHLKRCWASLFSERAMLYRLQNNVAEKLPAIAVVVQKMVDAAAAGILFTADPVSGHRGRICIEAGYGLGEALVSGLVKADLYVVDKEHDGIIEKQIRKKELRIVSRDTGGIEKRTVADDLAEKQVLSDSMILRLAQFGKQAEAIYGAPQDMEWCCKDDALYILQCRPITSLFPLAEPIPRDHALHAYLSFGHIQVMTEPISPLGIDLLRCLLAVDTAPNMNGYPFYKTAGGRIYFDISHLLAARVTGRVLCKVFSNAEYLSSAALSALRSRPDFQKRIDKRPQTVRAVRGFLLGILRGAAKNILFRRPEGEISAYTVYMADYLEKARAKLAQAGHGRQKLLAIGDMLYFRDEFTHAIPKVAAGIAGYKAAEKLEKRYLGTNCHMDRIVSGLEGSFTSEMGLQTADLSAYVSRSPELLDLFLHTPPQALAAKVAALDGHLDFRSCFEDFMRKFGMRGSGEIDVARKRWCEDPAPLMQSILSMAQNGEEQTQREEYRRKTQTSLEQEAELIRLVRRKKGWLRAKLIHRMLRLTRSYLPLRETPKHLLINLLMLAKKDLLAEARLLVDQGRLEAPEDIFYLGYWQMLESIETDCDYRPQVAVRKAEYAHDAKLNPPRVMTSDGEEIKVGYECGALPENTYAGMPTSAGRAQGIARVVLDPARESVAKGEILIAPFTDPAWTPLFLNASALVAEVGGMLTHGSVVAREYGIPAVVGVENATKLIQSGRRILVDGDRGLVQILDDTTGRE